MLLLIMKMLWGARLLWRCVLLCCVGLFGKLGLALRWEMLRFYVSFHYIIDPDS